MIKGLIGKKLNMTQGFDSHGKATPITNLLVEPGYIVQVKSAEKDAYKSVQLGAGLAKKLNKPMTGHVKKSSLGHLPRALKEFQFDGEVKVGQEVSLGDVFSKGSLVDVVGISKGKGFAGVVKRHGFAGGPRTHGQSDRERAPGSIGATTTPGRVYKGTKMAGHMGAQRVKVQALEVSNIDKEKNTLSLKGSVPGPAGGLLIIEKSKKKKKKYHEPEIPTVPALGGKEEKETEESDEAQDQGAKGSEVKKEESIGESQAQPSEDKKDEKGE
jgi:large subunit ribosomal protein L3